MTQQLGKLTFQPTDQAKSLLGVPVDDCLKERGYSDVWVSEIDPNLADTAAFCKQYEIDLDVSANCVIVEAKRGDRTWYAACVVLATNRADVNGMVRKTLNARKVSFAPMDIATSLTHMEYGGITPIGLPSDWPILIDSQVIQHERVILGSGIRGSKVLVASERLRSLSNAKVSDISKK
ncbi:MAG TPA: YbaK/EbsC family protein [Candidatus Saccharimonadia bacterium]|nr:YbaK/EbsC family protein [Candidatus Saccharimonadia bacterium]